MSFVESIDFSNYGIQFDCSPDTVKLPESIKRNILPVVLWKNREGSNFVKFTKKDGSEINMKLWRQLGKGSYGEAWLTDTEIDKGVKLIVKVIGSSHINTTADLANYEYDIVQEAITQIVIYESTKDIILPDINLSGPFAPKLFLIGKDTHNFYIVSERLDAKVDDFLVNIPTADFIKTTIVQLSKILEILYEKIKFNHRDLKPDNIMFKMINKKINVRLIDFGFSCLKYRKLSISAISQGVYASRLHCNSKIRDMHSFLYYLVYYTAYKRVRCPLKRLINALIASSNVGTPSVWANTYLLFDKYNSEGESAAALNCAYDIVHNIFLSIKFSSDESCSNINADWTKHLVSLNLDTNKFLTDEEYKNIRPEVLDSFLLPYLKKNLTSFWKYSSSDALLITEFKYVREVYSDTCTYNSTKKLCGEEFDAPPKLIPLLFDEFMDGPQATFLKSGKNNETILHKIVKNKDVPNANKYLDRVLSASDNYPYFINMKSSGGESAYDISLNNNYKYAQEKLIMYVDIKSGPINLKMLDTILEPDNTYFNNKTEAYLFILYNIIKANRKEYNERVDKFISKISVDQLKKIMFDNSSGEKISYTPLDMAILLNNVYVIRIFLQYDLPVTKNRLLFNISSIQDEELITKVLDKYMDVSFINDYNAFLNATPLINAVKYNNLTLVKKLVIVPSIKYSKQDNTGNTCLHHASILASTSSGERQRIAFEIIKLLLDNYVALADIKNKEGMGPANPKIATAPNVRTFIKERKSTLFKKNPNAEKTTRVGGRLRRKNKRSTLKRR